MSGHPTTAVNAHVSKRDVEHPRAKTVASLELGIPGPLGNNSSQRLALDAGAISLRGIADRKHRGPPIGRTSAIYYDDWIQRYCDLGELCVRSAVGYDWTMPLPDARLLAVISGAGFQLAKHCALHAEGELTSFDARRLELFCNCYAGVTEKHRNLINVHDSVKDFRSECVPEQMRVATLRRSVELLEVVDDEESSETSSPIYDGVLR